MAEWPPTLWMDHILSSSINPEDGRLGGFHPLSSCEWCACEHVCTGSVQTCVRTSLGQTLGVELPGHVVSLGLPLRFAHHSPAIWKSGVGGHVLFASFWVGVSGQENGASETSLPEASLGKTAEPRASNPRDWRENWGALPPIHPFP